LIGYFVCDKINRRIKLFKKMENEIKEAETVQPKLLEMGEENNDPILKKKKERYFEIGLYVVLGILLGIAIKTEANKRLTMGFDDHLVRSGPGSYNINQLQVDLAEKRRVEAEKNPEVAPASLPSTGGYCGN